MLSPLWSTAEGLFFYATVFGFMSGGYGYIKASVSLMLGRELYGVSFSWFLLLEGFGLAFGPTIGGKRMGAPIYEVQVFYLTYYE